jgi:hypothetical protein
MTCFYVGCIICVTCLTLLSIIYACDNHVWLATTLMCCSCCIIYTLCGPLESLPNSSSSSSSTLAFTVLLGWRKTLWIFFCGLGKSGHFHSAKEEHFSRNDCFSQQWMIVSHSPTKMIGPGGENYIVSHLVQSSIFSGWGLLGGGERNEAMHTRCGKDLIEEECCPAAGQCSSYIHDYLLFSIMHTFCNCCYYSLCFVRCWFFYQKALGLRGWERGQRARL